MKLNYERVHECDKCGNPVKLYAFGFLSHTGEFWFDFRGVENPQDDYTCPNGGGTHRVTVQL